MKIERFFHHFGIRRKQQLDSPNWIQEKTVLDITLVIEAESEDIHVDSLLCTSHHIIWNNITQRIPDRCDFWQNPRLPGRVCSGSLQLQVITRHINVTG